MLPLVVSACTSPSASAVNVVLATSVPFARIFATWGRPEPLIWVKLPPTMTAPVPSVASAFTVPFALAVQPV